MSFSWIFLLLSCIILIKDACAGEAVIKYQQRYQEYNPGVVMSHVIGSGSLNFQYYFYILGVQCEYYDPQYWKQLDRNFFSCMKRVGLIPSKLRNKRYGSVEKACYEWDYYFPCHKAMANGQDQCLVGTDGSSKKGTDGFKFTDALAEAICFNPEETEKYLVDRLTSIPATRGDEYALGVYSCFPKLQERLKNCVKRNTPEGRILPLCGYMRVVYKCYLALFNDRNCRDLETVDFMRDVVGTIMTTLKCEKEGGTYIPPSTTDSWSKPPPPQTKPNFIAVTSSNPNFIAVTASKPQTTSTTTPATRPAVSFNFSKKTNKISLEEALENAAGVTRFHTFV